MNCSAHGWSHTSPADRLATFAQHYEYDQMLKACVAVRQCISFTMQEFGDATSWLPGVLHRRALRRHLRRQTSTPRRAGASPGQAIAAVRGGMSASGLSRPHFNSG